MRKLRGINQRQALLNALNSIKVELRAAEEYQSETSPLSNPNGR
jgi:hypothetical protein